MLMKWKWSYIIPKCAKKYDTKLKCAIGTTHNFLNFFEVCIKRDDVRHDDHLEMIYMIKLQKKL